MVKIRFIFQFNDLAGSSVTHAFTNTSDTIGTDATLFNSDHTNRPDRIQNNTNDRTCNRLIEEHSTSCRRTVVGNSCKSLLNVEPWYYYEGMEFL